MDREEGRFIYCGHGPSVYEELVRVPLIWRKPRGKNGGRVCDDLVALLDVAPSIIECVRSDPPALFQGVSFWEMLRGTGSSGLGEGRAVYFDRPNRSSGLQGIFRENDKLAQGGSGDEIFDLSNGPDERANLSEARPELAAGLRMQLTQWVSGMVERGRREGTLAVERGAEEASTVDEVEYLRALGYAVEDAAEEGFTDAEFEQGGEDSDLMP